MTDYLLEMKNISKSFPGVQALKDVSIHVKKGEVHGLIGENGAGKSTLFKVLAGVYQPDSGEIVYEGEKRQFLTPKDAFDNGIATIYQELSILPELKVAENIFLGRLPKRSDKGIAIDWDLCYKRSNELLEKLNLNIDPRTKAGNLKVAQQQMVEIIKALSHDAKLIVMDEPTTALTSQDVECLIATIQMLKERGISVLYVSHRLEEIKRICDAVTIFRDGELVDTLDVKTTEIRQWVRLMVGREVDEMYPKKDIPIGDEHVCVKNFCQGKKLKNVCFNIRKGEILGIFGLVGAGRTELARAIIGADKVDCGEIYFNGERVNIDSPRVAIKNKIGFVPEDRKEQGLVLPMTVKENITMANIKALIKMGKINVAKENSVARKYVNELKIVTPSINQQVTNLSGGNQQKVVIAKGLYLGCDLLIIDEPTKGIDVAAKVEIYNILTEMVSQNKSVIMISSEIEELMGMADRIIVMHEGTIKGDLLREEFNKDNIMAYATGILCDTEEEGLDTKKQSAN